MDSLPDPPIEPHRGAGSVFRSLLRFPVASLFVLEALVVFGMSWQASHQISSAGFFTGALTTVGIAVALFSRPRTTAAVVEKSGYLAFAAVANLWIVALYALPALLVWSLVFRLIDDESLGGRPVLTRATLAFCALVVVEAVAVTMYWLLKGELSSSAAFFVGLPAVVAIVITLLLRPASFGGVVFKVCTLLLLTAGILLKEGLVCLIMAAPLFYAVAFAMAWVAREVFTNLGKGRRTGVWLILPLVLAASLEGTMPALTFPRAEVVTVTHTVHASAAAVEAALAAAPQVQRPLPLFLQLGWPAPVSTDGAGLAAGDRRTIAFRVRELPRITHLTLEVTEATPGMVRFAVVADNTPLTQWLQWRETSVQWAALPSGATGVTWTARYDRTLDPVWYFGPLERFGVGQALDYLAVAASTP